MSEAALAIPAQELEVLFDALASLVLFVKDQHGRYTHANLTLVRRLGLKRRSELIGRTANELFPASPSMVGMTPRAYREAVGLRLSSAG